MAAGGAVIDPIHQFEISKITNITVGGLDLSFTNASLFMVIALGVISLIMIWGTSARAVVPGRLQSIA